MAITYGQLETRYLDLTKDDSTTNTTRAEERINEINNEILSLRDWYFMEKERTTASVADQQEYQLPVDYNRLLDTWVVVGGVTYYPEEITDTELWQYLNSTTVSSDITTQFIILDKYIYYYPIFSSTDATIHLFYRRKAKHLSADDYTTGTISTTAGSQTVTGSGTSWTSAMVGRHMQVDGYWYEISAVGTTTSITLAEPALVSVSGDTYTIGELSPIPEEFHDLLLKGSVAAYYDYKGDTNPYRAEYEKRLALFVQQYGSRKKTAKQVIRRNDRYRVGLRNPNDYPTGLS